MIHESFLSLFLNSLEKIDVGYLAYLMANTKVEQNLFGQIGYHLDLYFQSHNLKLFTAVEYSAFHSVQKKTKRIDFTIIEEQPGKKEDKIICVFEGKCYYTWDAAEHHWLSKWFNPEFKSKSKKDSTIPFIQCQSTVNKMKRLHQEPALQKTNIFFVLFLIHFGKKVPRNFPYYSKHNAAVKKYDNEPERLIPQSSKLINALYPKLGLELIHYDVKEEFSSYKDIPMGLIITIGRIEK